MRSGVGVIRLPALQVIKFIMTRQIFDIYQFVSRHAKAQPNSFADARIKNWHSRHYNL
jgi:hypothetical protein